MKILRTLTVVAMMVVLPTSLALAQDFGGSDEEDMADESSDEGAEESSGGGEAASGSTAAGVGPFAKADYPMAVIKRPLTLSAGGVNAITLICESPSVWAMRRKMSNASTPGRRTSKNTTSGFVETIFRPASKALVALSTSNALRERSRKRRMTVTAVPSDRICRWWD